MTNPEKILTSLDRHLTEPMTMTVYGRAAIALAYPSDAQFAATLDVDVIIPSFEVAATDANEQFWLALEASNKELEADGLYLTHLFLEEQVILRPGWLEKREGLFVPGVEHLTLFRPSVPDLILTKMMRVDPQDRQDICFLLSKHPADVDFWKACIAQARAPPLAEIQQAFDENCSWLMKELTR